MKKLFGAALLAASMLVPGMVSAADFPTRPVTIIAGFNAGGTSDMILRGMAPHLEKELGQPVLIVNRGGSGGALAIGDVLTKPTDGYTVGLVTCSAFTLDVHLRKARYSLEEVTFLGSAGVAQEGFFSLPDKPWKDFKTMVEYFKANKDKTLILCSPGIIDEMMIKVVCAKEGIKYRKVPVKSGGETATQILGGHVDVGYGGGIQTPYVQAGKMINLASTTATPFVHFPDCQTLKGLGYPNTGFNNFYAFFVLNKTPKDVCDKLAAAFDKVARLPEVQDVILNKAKLDPTIYSAAEIPGILKQQREDYKALIQSTK